MDTAKLFVFLTAAFLLAIAPGPGMLYVLARSLAGGKREDALSALGTFVGGMVHVFAAAAGVSVILAKSAAAFAGVKYAGASYLCFLGIRMILEAHRDARRNDAGQNKASRDCAGRPPRQSHSLLRHFPPAPTHAYRSHHGWLGRLSGDGRKMKPLQRNDLMVQAIRAERVIEAPQKFGTMARHKVQAADLPLLQDPVGIKRIAQQFSMAS